MYKINTFFYGGCAFPGTSKNMTCAAQRISHFLIECFSVYNDIPMKAYVTYCFIIVKE